MTTRDKIEKILHSDPDIWFETNKITDRLEKLIQEERKGILKQIRNLEKEMVEGAGWERMHELVLKLLLK